MAKVKKFVKLGNEASSFFDATSGLKLTPGAIVELTRDMKNSRRVSQALRGGHIQYADPSELEDQDVDDTGDDTGDDTDSGNGEEHIYSKNELNKLNKQSLIDLAITFQDEEDEESYTLLELEEMTKAELVEEILEKQGEEDEEE